MKAPTDSEIRDLLNRAADGWAAMLYLAEFLGHGDRKKGLDALTDMIYEGRGDQ